MSDLIEREQKDVRSTEITVRPPAPVPPRKETPAIVRWIQWSVVLAAVAAVVVVAIIIAQTEEAAESTLVPMGERYANPEFDVGFRWVGESGLTLEQIDELTTAPLVPMGVRYTAPDFDAGPRFAGESDMTLEELDSLWGLMAGDLVVDGLRQKALAADGLTTAQLADAARWTALAEALSPGPLEGLGSAEVADAARLTSLAEAYGFDMSG